MGTRVEETPACIDALILAGLDWRVVWKDVCAEVGAESTGKLTIFTIALPAYREKAPGPEKHRKTA